MREEIIKIITYHSDEGTSGYLLSEEQIDQLLKLFNRYAEEERNICMNCGKKLVLKIQREQLKKKVEK